MPDMIVKKDGTDYPLQTMPLHYPADRVYLDGDTTKNVQDALDVEAWDTSITGISYRKITGHFVELNIAKNVTISSAGRTLVMTLPTGYRPSKDTRVPCLYESSAGGYYDTKMLEIFTNGEVNIYTNNLNNTFMFFAHVIFGL